jgi:hypothetical protein
MQSQAACRADLIGDAPGAAVCRFLEAVYRLKQVLVMGLNAEVQQVTFSVLEQAFCSLVEQTRGSDLEVSWGQVNGPCHMIEACLWLNQSLSGWDSWVEAVQAATPKLGAAWEPALRFVNAAVLYHRGESEVYTDLTQIAGDTGQVNEIRALALLLLARRALAEGDHAGLTDVGRKAAVEFIAKMPEQGAQHVIAVAKRELAKFDQG